jgi:hypothetical protein
MRHLFAIFISFSAFAVTPPKPIDMTMPKPSGVTVVHLDGKCRIAIQYTGKNFDITSRDPNIQDLGYLANKPGFLQRLSSINTSFTPAYIKKLIAINNGQVTIPFQAKDNSLGCDVFSEMATELKQRISENKWPLEKADALMNGMALSLKQPAADVADGTPSAGPAPAHPTSGTR